MHGHSNVRGPSNTRSAEVTQLPARVDAQASPRAETECRPRRGHALALFRYGLTEKSGAQPLHNIWGMHNDVAMGALSLGVILVYTVLLVALAVRLFTKMGTS